MRFPEDIKNQLLYRAYHKGDEETRRYIRSKLESNYTEEQVAEEFEWT